MTRRAIAWFAPLGACASFACGAAPGAPTQAPREIVVLDLPPIAHAHAADAGAAAPADDAPAPEPAGLLAVLGTPDGAALGAAGDDVGAAFGSGALGLSGLAGLDASAPGVVGVGPAPVPAEALVGTPVVHGGGLTPLVAQRALRDRVGAFRLCYARGLAKTPKLAGGMTFRLAVGPDGAALGPTELGGRFPDATVVGCVGRAIGLVRFPRPVGGGLTTVEVPIVFTQPTSAPTKAPAKAPAKAPVK